MSKVTNIVFAFSILEGYYEKGHEKIYHNLERINRWLVERNYGDLGQDVDAVAGGTKHLETPLFVAAFNFFSVDAFVNFVRSLEWQEKEGVQIFVKDHGSARFSLLEPFGRGE